MHLYTLTHYVVALRAPTSFVRSIHWRCIYEVCIYMASICMVHIVDAKQT